MIARCAVELMNCVETGWNGWAAAAAQWQQIRQAAAYYDTVQATLSLCQPVARLAGL